MKIIQTNEIIPSESTGTIDFRNLSGQSATEYAVTFINGPSTETSEITVACKIGQVDGFGWMSLEMFYITGIGTVPSFLPTGGLTRGTSAGYGTIYFQTGGSTKHNQGLIYIPATGNIELWGGMSRASFNDNTSYFIEASNHHFPEAN